MRFDCFGSRCGVWAATPAAEEDARRCLENWHLRFSRFVASSELSRLNADPRDVVAVSTTMTRLIETVREAAEATGGLVDGTLLGEIEAAGYTGDLGGAAAARRWEARCGSPPARAAALPRRTRSRAGRRSPSTAGRSTAPTACASTAAGWPRACSPTSSPSACRTTSPSTAAATCASAARRGGWRSPTRSAARRLHVFELETGAAATSGIGRRSWLGPDGRPAHHLLDPATGRPAFTGVVQATALAPTAVEAEWRAKAAVLSGPDRAAGWLAHGGVVVLDDGSHFITQGARHEQANL